MPGSGPHRRQTHEGLCPLFQALDATTAQSAKLVALVAYLRVHRPPMRPGPPTFWQAANRARWCHQTPQRRWPKEAAGLPEWLFEESYQAVGDLAENLALLLPPPTQPTELTLAEWMAQLLPLRACRRDDADARLRTQWDRLAPEQRFVYSSSSPATSAWACRACRSRRRWPP